MSIRWSSASAVLVALGLVAAAFVGHAQVAKPNVNSETPCCAITGIDGETGIVTARITSTRRALAFKVTDTTLLRSLRVGQTVNADLRAKRVSVNGIDTCCAIVTLEADRGDACCAIASINAATGFVTARISATGRELTFKVDDAAVLPALRIGQTVSADFPANRVSVYPGTTCCAIVSDLVHAYEVDGVDVVLLSVQRTSGDTLTVRWQYRNTTSQPRKVGESFHGMGSSEAFSLVWDAYLLDGRTRFPVQKDDAGNLMAARHGGNKVVTIAAKETFAVWARFPAPPIATTKITVFIPGTEPFEDIAIAAATGQTLPASAR